MPSLFRVQRSTRIRLTNLVDSGRISTAKKPSVLVAAGDGIDPREWNMVLRQNADGVCGGSRSEVGIECKTTAVLDRPVLWEWDGRGEAAAAFR
jgi:hypothetical protein